MPYNTKNRYEQGQALRKEIYMYIPIYIYAYRYKTESLCRTSETNTIL